jgi:hypothetical protein
MAAKSRGTGSGSQDFLLAVGAMTSAFSSLEVQVAIGIWLMLDDQHTGKGTRVTTGTRLPELARMYAALAEEEAPDAAAEFGELLPRIESLNARHDEFAHPIWGAHTEKGKDVRVAFTVQGGRWILADAVTAKPQDLKRLTDDVVQLAQEIATITQRHIVDVKL